MTHGGRHRKLRQRAGIVSGALIIAAGLAVTVSIETASHTLTPAANAATTATVPGTDVSNFSTVTSWPDVQATPMAFTGVMAYDGATIENPDYVAEVTGALSAGLYVMPYVVADPLPSKVATGTDQFNLAWSVIDQTTTAPYGPGGQYLPIALDLEAQPKVTSSTCYTLNPTQMKAWIEAFIVAAHKTGLTPVIYSSPNWWNSCVGATTEFSNDPLWIADYNVSSPAIPSGWSGYTFWQYSDTATVDGITPTTPPSATLDQFEGAPQQLTETKGGSGSVPVQTLNSLAGQTVAYTAAGSLPKGVSLTPENGQWLLSWTSATPAGRYPITVIPASATAGAVLTPSSIPVTLNVHGSISLAVANRSATAGAPVVLGVSASGPDQSAGYAATLKATGLPAGLSMSPDGKITGWATKPGTFKVTVKATDPLGGSGSATFTWTVGAAADAGTAGPIRQAGGSSKCLDDPSAKTANGTPVDLSSCTGKASQKWTVVQDGTIRTGGKCLDVVGGFTANGARLQLAGCNSADLAQVWQAATGGQLVNIKSGKCLDVPAASAANGTRPVIEPCASSATQPSEHWLRPAAPVLSGTGKCLATSGTAVVIASCANTAAQHWQPLSDGTLRLSGKCLTESGTTANSVLSLGSCSGAAATKWNLVSAGPIATEIASPASALCVTAPAAGTRLVIAACASTPTGTWHIE